MRSFRTLAAGTAALVAVSLLATACDASPYAAVANDQVIKQTALNAEIRIWAGNPEYVSAFNSSNSSSGITVTGDAPNTFNASWVANILGGMIRATVTNQHLVATNNLPSQATVQAAQSVGEISQVGWYQFPASFRQVLTTRTAEAATLGSPSVPVGTLEQVFKQYQQYFFTQICTLQAAAFNQAEAQSIVAAGVANGSSLCYDQSQLEEQPASVRSALMGGSVGTVLHPVPTTYGYMVFKITSRAEQGFTPSVQAVLSYAIEQAQGTTPPALAALLQKAHVRVNPAYGTWSGTAVAPRSPPGAGASESGQSPQS